MMRRLGLFALILVLVVSLGASARKRRRSRAKKPVAKPLLEKAEGPVTLRLEAVDLNAARVVARVTGVTRAPASRLFAFHDDRDRHFIAIDGHCEAAGEAIRCRLDLPRPYLKAQVMAMTVHLRGREIEADPAEVRSLFAAARAAPTVPAVGDGGVYEEVDAGAGADGGAKGSGEEGEGEEGDEGEDGDEQREEPEDTEEWRYLKGT